MKLVALMPWHPIDSVMATRDAIAGVAGGAQARPGIVWTENGGIVGVALP